MRLRRWRRSDGKGRGSGEDVVEREELFEVWWLDFEVWLKGFTSDGLTLDWYFGRSVPRLLIVGIALRFQLAVALT